jgi:hypothetical protein
MERMQADTLSQDREVLEKLNKGYVDSVQNSDVRWFCVAAHVTRA